ncbi:HNH endonuclease signature motif containing protein [Auritidibacter ignavus]|uniref:HNH endonuclease signature motif containing protein n=1 Tax=Auritidibacter ignavus TaxID=678932 RepID=UPI00244BEC1D|nr:HNH endonuclease signature motif containing protein [Auritidibacter ignavus]WGH83888.1 HNH endonuclease signature motif containing protein [Auritidibacter ignavus]
MARKEESTMVRTASPAPPHGPDITAFLDLQAADQASLGELAHGIAQLLSAFNAKLDAEDSYEMFAHWSRAAEVSDWNTSLAGSSEPQHPQEPEDLLAPEEPHNAFPEVARRVEQSATLLTSVQTRLLSFAHQATRSPEDQRALLGVPTGSSMTYGNGRIFYLEALGLGKPDLKRRQTRSEYLVPAPPPGLGEAQPVQYPELIEAFSTGRICVDNADRLIKLLKDLQRYGRQCQVDQERITEVIHAILPILIEDAASMSVSEFSKVCKNRLQTLTYYLDEDGPAPEEELDPKKATDEFWVRPLSGGGVEFGGRAFGLSAELLSTLDHAANNYAVLKNHRGAGAGNANPETRVPESPIATALKANFPQVDPEAVAAIDENSREILYAEHALFNHSTRKRRSFEALMAVLIAGIGVGQKKNGLAHTRGQATKVLVTMDYETFSKQLPERYRPEQPRTGAEQFLRSKPPGPDDPDPPGENGHAFRSEGQFTGSIHPSRLRTLACEAGIVPILFDGRNDILDYGRERRDFSPAQHRALVARDKGCTAPGCTMPASWCQVHHIVEWENHGATRIDNAALVCSRHHTEIHQGKWSIARIDRDGVWYAAAPWHLPDLTLRRNGYFLQ